MELNNTSTSKESQEPIGRWSKEICAEETLKYSNRTDFRIKSRVLYNFARKNGWLDEICSHMIRPKPSNFKWTLETCKEEALKYSTKFEFKKNSGGAYCASVRNKWYNEVCAHMIEGQKPDGYWTFEKCKEEALKCKNKVEFRNKGYVYSISYTNGWLDEICSHMEVLGNTHIKFVYVFEFSDKSAYVGLTKNVREREIDHLNKEKSQVYKHIKKTGTTYNLIQITKEPIQVGDAQELEHQTILEYKNNGWNVLNIGATGRGIGSIGGDILFWTFEKCKEEALKYSTKVEFRNNSGTVYTIACKNGWFNEITSHMEDVKKPNGYWTKEICAEEALKYNSKNDFQKKSRGAYMASHSNKWLEEICSHMTGGRTPNNYWTYDLCKEEALKYSTKVEFKKNSGGAYKTSCKNKWLEEICSHMKEVKKPDGFWTLETCKEEALKYSSRSEFFNNSNAYHISRKNGWIDEVCSHMEEKQKPNGYWTFEKCKEEALKYNSRKEFEKKSGSAHTKSMKNRWLDEICSHMIRPQVYNKKWSLETCKEEALKYNSRKEFSENSGGACSASYKNGWINVVCAHMTAK